MGGDEFKTMFLPLQWLRVRQWTFIFENLFVRYL